jgi:hypothetical protein
MLLPPHTSAIYSSGTRPLLAEDIKGNFKEKHRSCCMSIVEFSLIL